MSKSLHHQIIADARDLVADEGRWIQQALAITRGRDRVAPHDPRAKRFCAMGALERAAFRLTGDVGRAQSLAHSASECLCPTAKNAVFELEHINDRQGHASVLKLFDDYLASGALKCKNSDSLGCELAPRTHNSARVGRRRPPLQFGLALALRTPAACLGWHASI